MKRKAQSTREERLRALAVADRALQMVLQLYPEVDVERKPPSPDRPKLMALAKRSA